MAMEACIFDQGTCMNRKWENASNHLVSGRSMLRNGFCADQASVVNVPYYCKMKFLQLENVKAAWEKSNRIVNFNQNGLRVSFSDRRLARRIIQENCKENNGFAVHTWSRAANLIKLVMKRSKERAKISSWTKWDIFR